MHRNTAELDKGAALPAVDEIEMLAPPACAGAPSPHRACSHSLLPVPFPPLPADVLADRQGHLSILSGKRHRRAQWLTLVRATDAGRRTKAA